MSVRNNQDRFGAPDQGAQDTAPTIAEQPTTGLSFTVPVEVVDLPSKGQFYDADHPLHNAETIEIRHMTAKEEDILTNKSYIKNGTVLDRLLESVIVDKSVKAKDLLTGDKSAILVAARISGYGEEYQAKVPCPNCGTVSEFEFDLLEAQIVNDPDESPFVQDGTVTKTDKGTFLFTLPKTGVTVEVRPLTGTDEAKILNTNKMRQKNKLPELALSDQIKTFIVSVNGEDDNMTISKFVENMPAIDSRFLRSTYKTVVPSVDLAQNWECEACSYSQVLEVPFTSEFFWPK
ncbi:MAG: T4 family baseplate hub assembly chaperone [Candidatus Kariarchaeaceae archaeon]|jgi:hypothetical protein